MSDPPAQGASPSANCPGAVGRSVTGEDIFPRIGGCPSLPCAWPCESPSLPVPWSSGVASGHGPGAGEGRGCPGPQPSRPHGTPIVLQGEKHYAQMVAWLWEDEQENEVLPKGLGENGWVPTGPGVGGRRRAAAGSGTRTLPSPRCCVRKGSLKRHWSRKRPGELGPSPYTGVQGGLCSARRDGTANGGDQGGGPSPHTSAASYTPRHVPAVPQPAGGIAGVKEA